MIDTVDTLKNDFAGEIIVPKDAGYDSARRIWNASIDKRPGVIARCSGVADVVRTTKFARENDLLGPHARRRCWMAGSQIRADL